ncbi:MAG: transporter substrate-binding domain-containing protein [Myxococcota bacterium]
MERRFGAAVLVVLAFSVAGCAKSSVGAAEPVLRIGTTGDYLPFTDWPAEADEPTGDDVDRARRFAREEGVRIVWVRTHWPTLMADLQAGRFDVAWSGITVTAERQRVAEFSRPYASGGKQAVLRCADRARITRENLGEQRGRLPDRRAAEALHRPGRSPSHPF